MTRAGDWSAGTVTVALGDVVVPDVPLATLVTSPASRSACVVVSEPVQVRLAPGTRPPTGRAGQSTDAMRSSVTPSGSVSVVLPVLVSSYV